VASRLPFRDAERTKTQVNKWSWYNSGMTTNKSVGNTGAKVTVDEIDLHRLTVEEAVPKIDEFLYKAYKAGHYRVWVIHGKGTGFYARR